MLCLSRNATLPTRRFSTRRPPACVLCSETSRLPTRSTKSDLAALQATYGTTETKTAKTDWFKEMNEIVDLTQSVKEIFESDDFEEKRSIMAKLGSNLVWNEKTLNVYNRKSIQKLVDGIKEIRQKYGEFEPKNYLANKGKNERNEALVPALFYDAPPAGIEPATNRLHLS